MTFTDKLRAAKAAAEKANKGSWFYVDREGQHPSSYVYSNEYTGRTEEDEPRNIVCELPSSAYDYAFNYEENGAYVATMNPSFALELIERYEALEGKLKEMADPNFAYIYKDRDEFGNNRETKVIGAFGPAVLALKELGK